MMPEEQCGKARYILDHFLNPVVTEDSQDHFKERSVRSRLDFKFQPKAIFNLTSYYKT